MPLFKRQPPQALYRGSIILGCLAFLLGVAGIFYFQHRDEARKPDEGAAAIWVHGLEGESGIHVVVRWEEQTAGEGTTVPRSESGALGREPAVFLFRRAPEGRPLDLVVYRHEEGERHKLHEQIVILTYGQNTYTAVPLEPTVVRPAPPARPR